LRDAGYVDFSPVRTWTQLFCVVYIYIGLLMIGMRHDNAVVVAVVVVLLLLLLLTAY
jgi:hypothetical protein